jgi:hypothetical protein
MFEAAVTLQCDLDKLMHELCSVYTTATTMCDDYYVQAGGGLSKLYLMQLAPGQFLDAKRKGGVGRFINHR